MQDAKYSVGDILYLKSDSKYKKRIVYVYKLLANEPGFNAGIHYYIEPLERDRPPSPISEEAIEKYYIKVIKSYLKTP
jgi:hypothetical protein